MTTPAATLRLPVTTVLAIWVLALVLISADWVLGPLGAFGSPATILGIGFLGFWILGGTMGGAAWPRETPLRVTLLLYLLWSAFTFVISLRRPTDTFALTEGLRALAFFLAAVGPCMLGAEALRSPREIARLVGVLLVAAAVAATVGLIQFRTSTDPSPWLVPPGLSLNDATDGLELRARSIFTRPRGTAQHPIEFGVVLAMLVPLAVWRARLPDVGRNARLLAWAAAGLIGIAALASVSRSAVVTLVTAGVVMFVAASWRDRLNGLVLGIAFIGSARLFSDGLLGTLLSFFRAGTMDNSITGRTEDYARVWDLVAGQPVVGVGWGRFNPSEYFFLDNQLLDTLLESGVIGLGLLLAIPAVAIWRLMPNMRRVDAATNGLGSALVAAILGGTTTFVTFDTLSFRMFYGVYFLLIGLAVATVRLWESSSPEGADGDADRHRDTAAVGGGREA